MLRAGRDRWERTDLEVRDGWGVRVAARGTTVDQGLAFDVVLVETPHRLRVVVGGGGTTVTWHTAPLGRPTIVGVATPRT